MGNAPHKGRIALMSLVWLGVGISVFALSTNLVLSCIVLFLTGIGLMTVFANVNSLVQRVAGTSLQEIDNLVVELQKLRDFLVSEGERVQREIAGYGELSKATLRSAKLIADSMPGRNFPPEAPRRD